MLKILELCNSCKSALLLLIPMPSLLQEEQEIPAMYICVVHPAVP